MAKNALKTVDPHDNALVSALLRHGDMAQAAADCGISEQDARLSVRKPYMREILLREYSATLIGELGPLAIRNIRAILGGQTKPDRGMIALCKAVLDRIGQPIAGGSQDAKPIEDMSIAELQTFIAHKEASLKDVTPPDAPPASDSASQLTDLLD